MGRVIIGQQRGNWNNTQTGRLDRSTLLHKRYMILRTIGQGGMGAVYQARDLKTQTICAVKEMSLSMVAEEERPQAIQNFRGEASILANLSHVNLPTFSDFFTEGSRYFLVMEFIDGNTLDDLLERNQGPFPEHRVLNWARQLCDVLEYLHNQQPPIIYRDMKPNNIMLMRNGRIKLIDFGIARFVRHSSSKDTQMLGTPGFAPPEQYGKRQTDQRSDIYSLAITLFLLLTNTLSEKGFGLKDVRSVNSAISPTVARALEKAAALAPEDRYENVAAFRRALLGVGRFVFEQGDEATTPEELAELCSRYPEEAADYLFAGEIESWLGEIGETSLAKTTKQIRTSMNNPEEGIERFLRTVMGPSAQPRNATNPRISVPGNQGGNTLTGRSSGSRPGQGRSGRATTPSVVINPRTIDFGQVYPGVSAPMSLTISGNQGAIVSGTLHPVESWISTNINSFDGMSTRVSVRVDSTKLRGSTHYSGTILVTPDDAMQDIPVKIEVDVLGYNNSTTGQWQNARSSGTVFDDADEEDEDDQGGMIMAPSQTGPTLSVNYDVSRDNDYKAKFGSPGAGSRNSNGWDPLQASPLQLRWLNRGTIFSAAFMVASLWFTLFFQVFNAHIFPPDPLFLLVLLGLFPTATLGALLVLWDTNWKRVDIIERVCTGLVSALIGVGLSELIWQSLIHSNSFPLLQMVFLLSLTAIGASVGTNAIVSNWLINGIIRLMTTMRWAAIPLLIALGATLGFVFTIGFTFFIPFGIVLGIGIAVGVLFYLDRMLKQNHP